MSSPHHFTCYIIGTGTLPVQCAHILQEQGHTIWGIVSPDVKVIRWAETNQIPVATNNRELLPFLRAQPFDYLFSIVNPLVLPVPALQLPRQMAINYHDAPLPRYAGVHATSWALLHQEQQHGITWHEMVAEVDAGDILRQVSVPIAADDTALTLNAKCYAAAIAAFTDLVADLENGRLQIHSQDIRQRSYFALCQRPPLSGFISWQGQGNNAAAINALVRALTFGPYPNRLGLPKLWLGQDNIFWVGTAVPLLGTSSQPSGTIMAVTADGLQVATSSEPLLLRQLTTVTGQPVQPVDLLARMGLHVGSRLPDLPSETAVSLMHRDAELCKYESFWRRRLATAQPASLPFLRYQRVPQSGSLPRSYAVRSAALAADDPLLLLAALAVYCFRLGQYDTFDLGFYAAQPHSVFFDALYTQYVPFRITLRADWTLAQVMTAVQTEYRQIQRHQTYSRDIILRYPELHGLARLSGAQPFPIAVALVRRLDAYQPDGVDCTLVIAADQGAVRWCYNPAALDDDTVRSLDAHLQVLLAAMQANPQQTVGQWPLLPEEEQRQVLQTWNETAVSYRPTPLVHDLVAARAAAHPGALAIVTYSGSSKARQWAYDDLNRRANQLAHHLQALGVGPNTCVGVLLPRSAELLVAQLAILKAGGAYLPIDPTYPRARIHFMITDGLDAEDPIVIATPAFAARLALDGVTTIALDLLNTTTAFGPDTDPGHDATPDSLAYVIYTSGTTGQPKGVQITHRGLRNLLAWHEQAFAPRPQDRFSQVFAPAFDGAVCDVWPAFAVGASVHIPDEETRLTPWLLRDWCLMAGITIAFLPTPLGERILSLEWPQQTALRLLRVGGDRLHEYPPSGLPFMISNEYGPTENSVVSTQTFLHRSQAVAREMPPPIGRPIANGFAYILDRFHQPVPVGVPGELYVGGDGLSPGYLRRPELTHLRFATYDLPVSHSLVSRRLYRTGDLAVWLPDGQLHFLGRLDYQVKIRGFRVELGEIEAVLVQQPEVETAVVVAYPHPSGDKQIVAYYVLRVDTLAAGMPRLSAADLRARLQQRLPDYMIPVVWIHLNHMPVTVHGKVNREALPPPTMENVTPYVPPRTETETAVARLWESMFDIHPIGADHAFFEMGGNSLLATQLIAQLQDKFAVQLSLRVLFEMPTVAALSAHIDAVRWAAQPALQKTAGWEEGEL